MAPKLAEILKNNPHEKVTLRMPAFHAVGNDFLGFPGQFQVRGSPNVGGAAIEYCTMSDEAKGVGKFYDKIIAYSHYTADFLSSLNVAPVVVCHQGVDTGMFHPRQKSGLYKNRFVIFSGGKFEHRKGQDIVLAAFKHFAARHDDALLVCAGDGMYGHGHSHVCGQRHGPKRFGLASGGAAFWPSAACSKLWHLSQCRGLGRNTC
ncbi:MAG: glycosyltransferase [Alphaproteobacteria bacterium]|nr:glycosyltransferase [Alphaproteobacteria bacterium]